jgi:hypothetical protein
MLPVHVTILEFTVYNKDNILYLTYAHNKQAMVGSLIGWSSLANKDFWASRDNVYECLYCYNRCHVNADEVLLALWYNIYDCECTICISPPFLLGNLIVEQNEIRSLCITIKSTIISLHIYCV